MSAAEMGMRFGGQRITDERSKREPSVARGDQRVRIGGRPFSYLGEVNFGKNDAKFSLGITTPKFPQEMLYRSVSDQIQKRVCWIRNAD